MILPERVFGTSAVQMIRFGPRELADPVRHALAHLALELLAPLEVALQDHERHDRLAGVLVLHPITAASATFGCETIADSTVAVESRWPDTFTVSSTRPITQK